MRSSIAIRLWVAALGMACLGIACLETGGGTATAADRAADAANPAHVEFFEKKVRPLLIARCHECHGPNKPKGNLRLDSRAGVLQGGDTGLAVMPGKPEESLLVDAIRYGDMYQMPPKSQLPVDEIATLVEWVRLGVPWGRETGATPRDGTQPAGEFDLMARSAHWSFQPLADVRPPEVSNPNWIKTPVDRFILTKLAAAGLAPAPPADRRALLRRVTYDLVGLPPTPEEIVAFLADDSPGAYQTVVDRLLASPHYGQRWARHWLDLVRYAETYGHEFDYDMPNAYRYRDYVIRAFNDDLPYDKFVVEHVAGDLLPVPRRTALEGCNESIIATGCFLFGEAKHSPVDARQDEADRIDNQIDVFAKTFLGLTVSCARCHDHKFDAISTKDYYALAGYLQSSRYQQAFIDPPEALAGTIRSLEELRDKRETALLEFVRAAIVPNIKSLIPQTPSADGASSPTDLRAALEKIVQIAPAGANPDESLVFADFSGPDFGGWQATGAAFGARPARPLDLSPASAGRLLGAGAAHSGLLSSKLQGALRSPIFEIVKSKIHYRLHGTGGQVRLILNGLQLIKDPIYGGLQFGPGGAEPRWHVQDTSKWIGERAYIEVIDDGDGWIALEQVAFADADPPAPRPNRLIAALLADAASADQLDQRYESLCASLLADWLANPGGNPADAADRAAIINSLLDRAGPYVASLRSAFNTLTLRILALNEGKNLVESHIAPPRQAMALADGTAENERVFIRGSHKTLGEEVPRRFLEVLGGTRYAPPEQGSGRLELARQLTSPDNPLLARVIVNRLWHHHFGAGLVRSVDDFGAMGQPPTHPELLDYLAAELVREGWSLKRMHRLMVLSSTYQMSSQAQPGPDQVDPTNKLWHRMDVRRLEAECIRDAVLAVSGRIDLAMYGPSVMPHLTEYMTGRGRPTSLGPLDGDGRRSIYLAVRRNFLSPMFLAFDYPTPFTTIGRRGASNVPAQALTMMNNPLVLEQARLWAARVLDKPDRTPAEYIGEMYLTALGRPPDDAELLSALAFVSSQREIGEVPGDGSPVPADVSRCDPQAWADFAHVLLNLKEFIFIP